jgi:hypothetical protein
MSRTVHSPAGDDGVDLRLGAQEGDDLRGGQAEPKPVGLRVWSCLSGFGHDEFVAESDHVYLAALVPEVNN